MAFNGASTAALRELIKNDVEESGRYQARIDQLRQDILDGKATTKGHVLGDVESQGKKFGRELAGRIDAIEVKPSLDATDREYLQALNARQVVWDRQIMQIVELNDLMYEARKGRMRAAPIKPRPEEDTRQSTPDAGTTRNDGSEIDQKRSASPIIPAQAERVADDGTHLNDACSSVSAMDEPHTTTTDEDEEGDHGFIVEEAEDSAEGSEEGFEESEPEQEPDRTARPLLYQILDVDPTTDPRTFDSNLEK